MALSGRPTGKRKANINCKGTLMQIEKAWKNDPLCISKVSWKFYIATI